MLILFDYIIFFKIEKNDDKNSNFELLLKTLFIISNFFDLLFINIIKISLNKQKILLFIIKKIYYKIKHHPYISFILYLFYKYNKKLFLFNHFLNYYPN